MSVRVPVFFVLFPGVDPTPAVEEVGRGLGKAINLGTFTNISMGQGQEKKALNALATSAKQGNWIMV